MNGKGDLTPKGKARREQILDCACRLFAQKGYDSASVRDLANAMGCSEALLFRYFPTKEALYDVLFEEYCAVLKAPFIIPRMEGETGRTWLERAIAMLPEYKEAMGRENLRSAVLSRVEKRQALRDAVSESSDIVSDLIIPIFRQGQADQTLPVRDCDKAACFFWMTQIGQSEMVNEYASRGAQHPLPSFDEILRSVLVM